MKRPQTACASARFLATVSLLALSATTPVAATTWTVDPNGTVNGSNGLWAEPSDVAGRVQDGDTVVIDDGSYTDCSRWTKSVTIESQEAAAGSPVWPPNVVLNWNSNLSSNCYTDASGVGTQGKAILLLAENTTSPKTMTVEDIELAGAYNGNEKTSPPNNAAGIRISANQNLMVDYGWFETDENGILTDGASSPTNTISISNSAFLEDGTCLNAKGCGHGIYAGENQLLSIDSSTFAGTSAYYVSKLTGNAIQSRAVQTTVTNSTIADNLTYNGVTYTGYSSYLINVPDGGNVTIENNTMEKGPHSQNQIAIEYGYYGTTAGRGTIYPSGSLNVGDLEINNFTNDLPKATTFVQDECSNVTPNVSSNNVLTSGPSGGPITLLVWATTACKVQ